MYDTNYTDELSAEALIKLLASHDIYDNFLLGQSGVNQLHIILKILRSWISVNLQDPAYE